jgi:AcrR family transcriptional regulator
LVAERSLVSDQRPYATLLAKGEDRRQRILVVAQRLLTRNGGRGTTLGQIAQEAGVSPAGLLHHFESKEQLLHAVLDARDADDDANADRAGDMIEQLGNVAERYRRAPEMIGMFTVLLTENLDPEAPLHERFLGRYRAAVDTVADGIRRGQRAGRYRADVDPAVKAVEIVAFLYGMETSWLLDPSIPLNEVFADYTSSLARQLLSPP